MMIEPYNDEEFERQKELPYCKQCYEHVERLEATVESLKKWEEEAFTYQAKAVKAMERVLELKEENAKLKAELEKYRKYEEDLQ